MKNGSANLSLRSNKQTNKQKMQIYTSYYAQIRNFSKEGIKPISISLGIPKFLKAPMLRVMMLAPNRNMLGMEYDEYYKLYIEKLKKVDWKLIKEILKENSNGQPIALCCYEALKTEGEWCHRTMLADYLNTHQKKLFGEIIEYRKPENKVEVSTQKDMFDGK